MKRVLATALLVVAGAIGATSARAADPPQLQVPPGYSAHPVAVDGDVFRFTGALRLGFDASGRLLVGVLDGSGGNCNQTGGVLYRVNGDGTSTTVVQPGLGLDAPHQIALGSGGPWGTDPYIADSNSGTNCGGNIWRVDGAGGITAITDNSLPGLGSEPRGVALWNGALYIADAATWPNLYGRPNSGSIERVAAPGAPVEIVATGAPLGDPSSLAAAPDGPYAGDLYIGDNGEIDAAPTGVPPSIERMDAAGNVSVFFSAPGFLLQNVAFAPAGVFRGLLYAANGAAGTPRTVVSIDAAGAASVFATLLDPNPNRYLTSVDPSPDGLSMYVLMHDFGTGASVIYRIGGDVDCSNGPTAAHDLIVPSGTTCSVGAGDTIGHDVLVQPGGTLIDDGAAIGNDVRADHPAGIGIGTNGSVGHDIVVDGVSGATPHGDNYICNTRVGNDVVVENSAATAAPWLIGDEPECTRGGVTLGRDLIVRDNATHVDVSENGTNGGGDQAGGIGHDLVVAGNAGATVEGNVVGNNATCSPAQTAADKDGDATINRAGSVNSGCDQIAPPTLTAPVNGLKTASAVDYAGTADPGATVRLLDNGVEAATAVADAAGAFSGTATLADGTHTLTATQSHDGITSAASAPRIVTVDTTPPQLSCAAADGSWHASDVSLTCTAADLVSGLADPADATFALTTSVSPGVETAFASTGAHIVCDVAGNCATAGPIGGNMVDRKPPTAVCGSPDGLWHNDNVTIGCSATDGGSGPASASFTLATSVAAGQETADAHTGTHDACDAVGNCTTAGPIGGNMVDRAPPALQLPSDITATNPVVTYTVTASDGTDPSPTVECAPASGTTFAVGTTAVTCTATDHAGNTATGSFNVTVLVPSKPAVQRLTDDANAIGLAQLKAHVRNLSQVGGGGYCAQLKVIAAELLAIAPQTPVAVDAIAATAELQAAGGCLR